MSPATVSPVSTTHAHRAPCHSRHRRRPLLTAATLAVALAALPLSAGEFTYFGSLGIAEGSYELSVDTTTLYLLNGFTYAQGRWRVTASIPVLNQDTPFVTWTGGSPIPSGRRSGIDSSPADGTTGQGSHTGSPTGRVEVPDPDTLDFSETGVGDPLVRAEFELSDSGDRNFDVYVAAKVPIADEDSGFGTGEWDIGIGLNLLQRAGPGNLLIEVGWWSLGDLPDLELKDPVVATLAYGSKADRRNLGWRFFVNSWSEIIEGQDGPAQAGGTVSRQVSTDWRASLTLTAGLTDSSADWGMSVGWSVTP